MSSCVPFGHSSMAAHRSDVMGRLVATELVSLDAVGR
jgi:hypothetical protein